MTNQNLSIQLVKSIESNLIKGFKAKDIIKYNTQLHLLSSEIIDELIAIYNNKFSKELKERGYLVDRKTQELIVKMIDYDIKG